MDLKQEKINDDLTLCQPTDSLPFGTDAYLLYAYLRRTPRARAMELGTGSGVVSLLCANAGKCAHIDAVEVQEEMAAVAAKNVETNGLSDRIRILPCDIRSLPTEENGRYDAVFANPPYMTAGSGKQSEDEKTRIARSELCGTIDDFCRTAARMLRLGGLFTVVFRPERLTDLICSLRSSGLEPKRMTFVYPTAEHVPCLVLTEAKKGAAPGLFLTRPLIIYQSRADTSPAGYTPDMNDIYENGEFHESYRKP
ncbi:MAG: methyltransferase [Ruminococcus sp.]|nr:methyltransferase [Candidatus Apopatosoma intestinale]